jgi:hypothetical protein
MRDPEARKTIADLITHLESRPRRWTLFSPGWTGPRQMQEGLVGRQRQSKPAQHAELQTISALYDRRGYNPEKAASFFATY